MQVIKFGCESFQPLLLDRILRLPFAAVDLGDVPKIEPARHGLFRALRLQIGGLLRRQKRQLWVKLHPMREVTLARPRATSLLILLQWELATILRHAIRFARAVLPPLASSKNVLHRPCSKTHKRKTIVEIQPTMAKDQRSGRVPQDVNAI